MKWWKRTELSLNFSVTCRDYGNYAMHIILIHIPHWFTFWSSVKISLLAVPGVLIKRLHVNGRILKNGSTKAGVKLTNIVGPTMWADKSWTIRYPISTMWKRVWSKWSHKVCILVSVKHFSPTNVCVMPLTETDLSQTSNSSRSWTQEVVNMAAPCWKLLWGWYVSGFKLMEDQEWAKKLTWKVLGTSSSPQFEKTSFKSEKKYENHRQAEYHNALKGRKTLSSVVPRTRTWDLSFTKRVCYQLSYPSEWIKWEK